MKRKLRLIAVSLIFACLASACQLTGSLLGESKKESEVFRGIAWGMTRDEVETVESAHGSRKSEVRKNAVMYEVKDIIDSDYVMILYTFEGKDETLNEMLIAATPKDGDALYSKLSPEFDKLYGKGDNKTASQDGVQYKTCKWTSSDESVDAIAFKSLLMDEVYITITRLETEND